jgi:hypothetical protein
MCLKSFKGKKVFLSVLLRFETEEIYRPKRVQGDSMSQQADRNSDF